LAGTPPVDFSGAGFSREEDRPIKPDSRVNEQIRVREVRLISQDGEQLGIVAIDEALQKARAAQLDLVEVAPEAVPPVCRIFDYKKVIYEQRRKMKEGRKKARASELKEIKMRVIIDPHDRATKLRKARELLERGDKVKFTLQFRGREVTKPQLADTLVAAIQKDLEDIIEVEKPAQRQDRFVHMIVGRRKDWKPSKTAAAAPEAPTTTKE
jgi:translation initiation factor IF-3